MNSKEKIAQLEAEIAQLRSAARAERSERPEALDVPIQVSSYGEAEDDLGTFRLGSETIRQSDVDPKTELYDILQAIANSDKNPNERFYELFNVVFEGRLGVLLVANTPSRG